ncbi:unnamed protein product [Amaranthus hypochondriacus]
MDSSPSSATFLLPASLPKWPKGQGFATGTINLGELEVAQINRFELIWGSHLSHDKKKSVSFYKPLRIPEGFFSFGCYCQLNGKPLNGYVLVAKDASHERNLPALMMPVDYTLVWISDDGMGTYDQRGYFWLPQSPSGYKALGFIVTTKPDKPSSAEVRCVREDLVDDCEACGLLLEMVSKFNKIPFKVFKTRPCDRGMFGKGVSVGTFCCTSPWVLGEEMPVVCLKNKYFNRHGMPNLDQIHALINHYGPTIYFHPKEIYFPSSVTWFFKNGALLFKEGQSIGEPIDPEGTNLPAGGENDKKCWIDFPADDRREVLKCGNLDSAEVYVHVKPALGGTFTDLAMWFFSPFNGPAILKIGPTNFNLGRTGEHIGDWEHFTLRISNFTGELHCVYFSQHSGGEWVSACDLEFVDWNRTVVYASKHGHACYPRPGTYLQGSSNLGIGIRNDCARSKFFIDSSTKYMIVAAEYLGEEVIEPCWLQFMNQWGPKIVYDSKKELDKVIKRLPLMIRRTTSNVVGKIPFELSGQEGPTGPKEKNNWFGDERW